MLRALALLCLLIQACAASTPRPPAAPPQAEPAAAPTEESEEPQSIRPSDGRDLIETPEQTYEREYGRCDFRHSELPSPLDQAAAKNVARLVVDPRDPSKLFASGDESARARARRTPLGQRLIRRGRELASCYPGATPGDLPINGGQTLTFRLGPDAAGAVEVVATPSAPAEQLQACLRDKLVQLVRGIRLDSELDLTVIVPNDALPVEAVAPLTDGGAIRRTIQGHFPSVTACYERALEVWSGLKGRLAIKFAISERDGSVLDARVDEDGIHNRALGCCVARQVYGWSFPPAAFKGNGSGITIVTYPFVLELTSD